MRDLSQTLSLIDDSGIRPRSVVRPHLVFVFCADRMDLASYRVRLDPVLKSRWGRSGQLRLHRDSCALEVGLPDSRMSRHHAQIAKDASGFALQDLGSKNGSLVNGIPVTDTQRLRDGDIIELGHSFFVFRDRTPTWVHDDDGPQGLGELRTFHGPWAGQLMQLAQVAASDVPVSVRGESGVGKEVAASLVHRQSGRKGAFVPVNCGALPEALVESELFGVERGAFSGADRDREGLVRAANHGTLFLDEIGELPLAAQVKLLRVLQERTVVPVGGHRTIPVDFRLVTATHRDLNQFVDSGRFREDLMARISGFTMEIPPLRDRREDIGRLFRELVRRSGRDPASIVLPRTVARQLMLQLWRYNVRELEKAVTLALTLAPDGKLAADKWRFTPSEERPMRVHPLSEEDEARRQRLVELLERHHGNISQVARDMGKARMQIHRWLKRYRIDLENGQK
ncbi:MAG: sigma 54-interacting transcriptional regulator [Myxococcota bacterium]